MESFGRCDGHLSRTRLYFPVDFYIFIIHFSISVEFTSFESRFLYDASPFDDTSQFTAVHSLIFALKLSGLYPRDLDKEIDTIEYRTWEPRTISFDRATRT